MGPVHKIVPSSPTTTPPLDLMGDVLRRRPETQGLATNELGHGETLSSSRKRKMRHTCSSAMANSSSRGIVHAFHEARQNLLLGRTLHRKDEGEIELGLVELIEVGEARKFIRSSNVPRPACACSRVESSVSLAFVARSGWARISASCAVSRCSQNRVPECRNHGLAAI